MSTGRQPPADVVREHGNLYGILKTHKSVNNFVHELYCAYVLPGIHNSVLVSIAEQFYEKGYISNKQVNYAIDLIFKERQR